MADTWLTPVALEAGSPLKLLPSCTLLLLTCTLHHGLPITTMVVLLNSGLVQSFKTKSAEDDDGKGILLSDLLSLFSYVTQDHLPMHSTSHSGLDPPITITDQEHVLTICLQANLTEATPQLSSLFVNDTSLCQF